ncbi:MAG: cupin domain-containing protein [Lentisphaerae bacterium]|nr:cupin domain-containing protein [Lentisphaerota bacterium]
MHRDGYQNISAKLNSKKIGLGWLSGITAWRTSRAVSMASHQHPHIELLFCLKGNLIYEISGYGAITVSEGSGLVIPAHTPHPERWHRHSVRTPRSAYCQHHVAKTAIRSVLAGRFPRTTFNIDG